MESAGAKGLLKVANFIAQLTDLDSPTRYSMEIWIRRYIDRSVDPVMCMLSAALYCQAGCIYSTLSLIHWQFFD